MTRTELADMLRPVAERLAELPDPELSTVDEQVVGLVRTWMFWSMAALEQSSPQGRQRLCRDAALSMLPILQGVEEGRYQ